MYRPDPEIHAPALGVRGNAKRALGRLVDAEVDLEEAEQMLDLPQVTDPATPAELYSYLGSLRKDQGRFEEAGHHFNRAVALYRLLRDPEKAARTLLSLGLVHYMRHDFAPAIAVTEEALSLLGSSAEDWLRGYAHYNLAHHLHAAGETDRAEVELAAHEDLIQSASDQLANLLVWLRARIAWSRDDPETAEQLFTEARRLALERGIAWDASLVALELALVHLVRGQAAPAKELALEAIGVFAEQQVERETRAALELLEAAARRDALSRDLLEQVISVLERTRYGRAGAGGDYSSG
jgi:tetratricopeptide (TPR) repeat protein